MPYTAPTAGDVHVSRPLTNFSQKYLQDESAFVATRAMPNMPVAKQIDKYYVFSRADFLRDEAAIRADGTESAGGGFSLSTDSYSADVIAYHKLVTDRQRANADEVVNLDQSASQFVTRKLLIKREKDFATAFTGASIWDTDYTPATDDKWNASTSDPIQQIRLARKTVQGTTGYRPNKMLLGRAAIDSLLDNDAVIDRVKGGATTGDAAFLEQADLERYLGIRIFVMDAVVNSAIRGATESTDFVLGDTAVVYYAPDTMGIDEPTAGGQFSWTGAVGNTANGMRIKKIRNEDKEADKIEGQMAYDYKVTGSELGYRFATVNG